MGPIDAAKAKNTCRIEKSAPDNHLPLPHQNAKPNTLRGTYSHGTYCIVYLKGGEKYRVCGIRQRLGVAKDLLVVHFGSKCCVIVLITTCAMACVRNRANSYYIGPIQGSVFFREQFNPASHPSGYGLSCHVYKKSF